jgi:hypothetical protein
MAIQLLAAPLSFVGRIAVGGAVRRAVGGGINRGAVAQAAAGAMSINVTSNLPAFAKAVDAFGKNQMPFAMSQALNDAAFETRRNTIERVWPSDVDAKNRSFMKAAMMPIRGDNRATKRKLRAIVQNHPTGAMHKDYLQRLAVGGLKHANGRSIAIPAQDRPPVRGRAGYNRNSPRTVLDRPKAFRQTVGGQQMILERRIKKRYPLKRLYLLEQRSLNVPKQFGFYEDSQRLARKAFNRNFKKRFAAAKRSAKRAR